MPTQSMAVHSVEIRSSSLTKAELDNILSLLVTTQKDPYPPGMALTLTHTMNQLVNIHI